MHGPDVMKATSDAVERPLPVYGVELARLSGAHVKHAGSRDAKAGLLEVAVMILPASAAPEASGLMMASVRSDGMEQTDRSADDEGRTLTIPINLRTMSPRVRNPTSRPSRTTGTRAQVLVHHERRRLGQRLIRGHAQHLPRHDLAYGAAGILRSRLRRADRRPEHLPLQIRAERVPMSSRSVSIPSNVLVVDDRQRADAGPRHFPGRCRGAARRGA